MTDEIVYLDAEVEEDFHVAQANAHLDDRGYFVDERVPARFRDSFPEARPNQIEYMDVSPKQVVSVATALIPFLEHDDANRALMGSNMQRQAVPLLEPEAPIVGTGMEGRAALDSGQVVVARRAGTVLSVTAERIQIEPKEGKADELDEYRLDKFVRSNQGTCINQRPIVAVGERVEASQPIADSSSTDNGELALGRNILVAFMSWEGGNYEDAIVISDRLVRDDLFTSIHIEKHEVESRDTKLGPEEITRDIPNVGEEAAQGPRRGRDHPHRRRGPARRHPGRQDHAQGRDRADRRGEACCAPSSARRHARSRTSACACRTASAARSSTSQSSPRDSGDELPPGVNRLVRVIVAAEAQDHRRRQDGRPPRQQGRDRQDPADGGHALPARRHAGRHHPEPARRAVAHEHRPDPRDAPRLGRASQGSQAARRSSMAPTRSRSSKSCEHRMRKGRSLPGADRARSTLRDGRTGEPFDRQITVGYIYMLKLHHLVDDKIHARSTGPYSLITQQPLGGKAQFGGQRFGEMEVWALEAYGAALHPAGDADGQVGRRRSAASRPTRRSSRARTSSRPACPNRSRCSSRSCRASGSTSRC